MSDGRDDPGAIVEATAVLGPRQDDDVEGAEAIGETFPPRPWIEPEEESEELSNER
jgi:hypothetical protein